MPRTVPTLIGLPSDGSSSFRRGAALAPPLIRAAPRSPAGNDWTEALIDLSVPGHLEDAGDLTLNESAAEARDRIEAGIAAVLAGGGTSLALGGDHSVTYPVMRAINRRHPRPTILHIDAHADLYDEFDGDRYSHACPFARIMEEELATRLVQVGIRTLTGHQREQANRFGVEVIALIQDISGTLVGTDVVELNPRQDPTGCTATVAAKLVKEIASRMLAPTGR